jgi:hypothetical protein
MPPGKRASVAALEAEAMAMPTAPQAPQVGENAENPVAVPAPGPAPVLKASSHIKQQRAAKRARGTSAGDVIATAAASTARSSSSDARYKKLQAKYEALRALRETEAEQIYRQHVAETAEREAASAAFVAQLQADNARLRAELDAVRQKEQENAAAGLDSSTRTRLDAEIRELESHLETAVERVRALNSQEELFAFLQQLTGASLRNIGAGDAGRRARLLEIASTRDPSLKASFELTVREGATEVECMWVPSSDLDALTSTAIKDALPGPLTDGAICFEPAEMPRFFKAVWAVMKVGAGDVRDCCCFSDCFFVSVFLGADSISIAASLKKDLKTSEL